MVAVGSKLVTKTVLVLFHPGSTLVISPPKLNSWLGSEETELSGVVVLNEMASSTGWTDEATGVGSFVTLKGMGMPLSSVPPLPVVV